MHPERRSLPHDSPGSFPNQFLTAGLSGSVLYRIKDLRAKNSAHCCSPVVAEQIKLIYFVLIYNHLGFLWYIFYRTVDTWPFLLEAWLFNQYKYTMCTFWSWQVVLCVPSLLLVFFFFVTHIFFSFLSCLFHKLSWPLRKIK